MRKVYDHTFKERGEREDLKNFSALLIGFILMIFIMVQGMIGYYNYVDTKIECSQQIIRSE